MRELAIAYGNSRQAKKWINKTIAYNDLKERLKVPIRTTESAEEYAKMSKADRDSAKDHGGFVGGALKDGRRKIDSVDIRSMVVLDGDKISQDFLDNFEEYTPFTSALYTTHSHTAASPRARIIYPATRDMSPDEAVAITRYVAQMLGIDYFDECSYQPNQLMYWPSTPQNGEFVFKEVEKEWLDPDVILNAHPEWKDPTRLPTSSRESVATVFNKQKVADPLEKEGLVGAFNRVYYPITEAIEKFLPDIYEATENPDRYHLIESNSMAGVEIIDGGRFCYSHHAKDPAYLKLCNAFDIVRIHKFGDEDSKKSFQEMADFVAKDGEVAKEILNRKQEEAEYDFRDWKSKLTYNRYGNLENSLHNIRLIMENDEHMRQIVFNQLADGMEISGDVPWKHIDKFWRDSDDAQLICYVDEKYGTFSQRNYDIAVTKSAADRSYHPIKDYLNRLPAWDGVPRVESLLIDYLGADDNEYVRTVTRKLLCAAVMRVINPGIKFDYILVMNGPQGVGKSTLVSRLGMEWYSDSLNISDMNDKTAAEKLQGYWILEVGELAGMKKGDIDKVKAFISRQDDKYRASFGRRVTPHPRQCVILGTTNSENGFLRDITGNRRFWVVKTPGTGKMKPWELTQEIVDQIWAEVLVHVANGEKLYLPVDLEALAKEEQSGAMEHDEREGIVSEYLDMLLPETWDSMDIYARRDYVRDPNAVLNVKGTVKRETVSNMEIWCECFGKAKEDMRPSDSYAIAAIMARLTNWEKSQKTRSFIHYGKQRFYKRKNG